MIGSVRSAAVLAWALLLPACSLLLNDDATQCHDDSGCARFPGTVCDQSSGVCIAGPQPGSGAQGAAGGAPLMSGVGGRSSPGNAGAGGAAAAPMGGGGGAGTGGGGGATSAGTGGQSALAASECPDLDGNGVLDCFESLVPNADFATGIAGWTAEQGITQSFSSTDGAGNPQSGSLTLTNPVYSAGASGSTMAGTTMCLPGTTADAYDVYLEVSVSPASDGATQAGVAFAFYPTADCSGDSSGIAPTTLVDQTAEGWRLVQEIVRPGQGTGSLLVRLVVVKPFSQPTAQASFDNLLVRAR